MTTGFQALHRGLLRISGADAEKFLQDLVSNDVTREGLIYAALLTPQGKFLADFFVLRMEGGFVLDTDRDALTALQQRLMMYKLRADVVIEVDPRPVWVVTDGEEGWVDPRHERLGRRYYGALDDVEQAGSEDWEAMRIQEVVPAFGAELVPNDSFLLECAFERMNGVDFRKGCYVGQEVTARMKHKTSLRKGIAGVSFDGPDVVPGAEITSGGKVCGTVTSVAGTLGIAYLRFDRAGDGMTVGNTAVTLRQPGVI